MAFKIVFKTGCSVVINARHGHDRSLLVWSGDKEAIEIEKLYLSERYGQDRGGKIKDYASPLDLIHALNEDKDNYSIVSGVNLLRDRSPLPPGCVS